MLKPYSLRNLTPQQRVFSYRLSRATCTAENAFSQLSQRFRVFGRGVAVIVSKNITTKTLLKSFFWNSSSSCTQSEAACEHRCACQAYHTGETYVIQLQIGRMLLYHGLCCNMHRRNLSICVCQAYHTGETCLIQLQIGSMHESNCQLRKLCGSVLMPTVNQDIMADELLTLAVVKHSACYWHMSKHAAYISSCCTQMDKSYMSHIPRTSELFMLQKYK